MNKEHFSIELYNKHRIKLKSLYILEIDQLLTPPKVVQSKVNILNKSYVVANSLSSQFIFCIRAAGNMNIWKNIRNNFLTFCDQTSLHGWQYMSEAQHQNGLYQASTISEINLKTTSPYFLLPRL